MDQTKYCPMCNQKTLEPRTAETEDPETFEHWDYCPACGYSTH